jgi:hypothetical protein
VENRDDLGRLFHLVADASADRGAWADQDAGRWGDHQKAKDRDCRLAWVHDFRWEEGHGCRLAKDVAVECRAGQKRQPQAGQLLADPAVAGRARRGAARAKRRYGLVLLGVKAVRAEQGELASVRMAVEPGTLPERMDVERLELRAALLLKKRVPALKRQLARTWAPVSVARLARKRAQKQLASGAFESQALEEE